MGKNRVDPFYCSPEWRRVRQRVIKRWKAQGLACNWCGKPLEWTKGSFIVDHIIPRRSARGAELALDETNLQVLHHGCNTKKRHAGEGLRAPAVDLDGFPPDWA